MKELTTKDYNLLVSLCAAKQKTLRKTLLKYLETKYQTVYHSKDYIMAIGEIPIVLVAHMDTVFSYTPNNIYYDKEKGVLWSPEGLGADDRAGIFLILKILQKGLKPTVIFTADEEKGAIGASVLIDNFRTAPGIFKYIIQLDRRGTNDCVFYDCNNPEFVEYIETFGFCENHGSFSDISIICPEWGIAGVNLSVGYENEHTYSETLHVVPLYQTLDKVINMLNDINAKSFKYIPADINHYAWLKNDTSLDDYEICENCQNIFINYSMIPCKDSYGAVHYYCSDCCVNKIDWCSICGEPFETDYITGTLCPRCKEKQSKGGKKIDGHRHNKSAV